MLTSPVVYMLTFMEAFRKFVLEHKALIEKMLQDGKFSPEEEKIIREVI